MSLRRFDPAKEFLQSPTEEVLALVLLGLILAGAVVWMVSH